MTMATLEDLIARRDALEKARASGRRSWSYEGESVTYGSDAEMRDALDALNRQIRAMGSPGPVRKITFTSSKGL